MSPAYSYEQDGQTTARRFPHRTSKTWSGWEAVDQVSTRPSVWVRTSRPRSRTGRAQYPQPRTCRSHASKSRAAGATEHLGEGPGVGGGARTLGRDGHGDPVRMRRGSVVSSRNAR